MGDLGATPLASVCGGGSRRAAGEQRRVGTWLYLDQVGFALDVDYAPTTHSRRAAHAARLRLLDPAGARAGQCPRRLSAQHLPHRRGRSRNDPRGTAGAWGEGERDSRAGRRSALRTAARPSAWIRIMASSSSPTSPTPTATPGCSRERDFCRGRRWTGGGIRPGARPAIFAGQSRPRPRRARCPGRPTHRGVAGMTSRRNARISTRDATRSTRTSSTPGVTLRATWPPPDILCSRRTQPDGGRRRLDELLRGQDGDAGCAAGEDILDAYVELELAGKDPARVYPGTAIHLQSCPGCRADHNGLLEERAGFRHHARVAGPETARRTGR